MVLFIYTAMGYCDFKIPYAVVFYHVYTYCDIMDFVNFYIWWEVILGIFFNWNYVSLVCVEFYSKYVLS